VDRSVNDNLKFNQETEFIPILGLIESQLNSPPLESDNDKDDKPPSGGPKTASSIQENHHPALLSLLASELSVTSEEIHDFEL
jgi:aspartyl aminopeptidase